MNEKIVNKIGWFASIMGMLMFMSCIDQIRLNVSGHPGSVILPIVTAINCTAWGFYGYLKIKKDWPLVASNAPGIVLGIIAAITAIMYK